MAARANETVYLDRMSSSLDRSHYPSLLLAAGRYYGDDYNTRMKWSPPDSVPAHCHRLHLNHHFLPSPSSASGTTNVAAEGPEMPCCDDRPPSLLADVTGDVISAGSGTVVVAGDTSYPTTTVRLYDNRPPRADSPSFHV